jgi:NADPH:quinone reductase-like Zn-dependent oxidoreductase
MSASTSSNQVVATLLQPLGCVNSDSGIARSTRRRRRAVTLSRTRWQAAGAGAVTTFIDRRFPLSEAPEALRYLGEGHAKGKVVITVG